MSTKTLIPGNSQRTSLTALNAFGRLASSENLTEKKLCGLIEADSFGDVLYIVLDKFAIHLAFMESSKGPLLSKNSVASYFGNVKTHLLELSPVLSAVTRRRLRKVASILDKYCAKCGTDFTHQAPPYTKSALQTLPTVIYKNATTP
ncbi:hypothetical protein PC129_g21684 [Phytophthora cactorum]|uniref:Uncharacterized protein n=1 Tax=Phytophthora cactorum TaxID=29920 RepID=A0A329RLT6_9STRA|nr:hypothetical protein PC112_g24056 [Phytophthora cactorum]KAG2876281.1 hypothetical protein PC114_g24269 [Phytophthora cactorum]KAG2940264.1 hypothetical protein PC117_g10583 [Phytophthora cactorum]KAG2967969.1 hypothetical protein PC119_g24328 [Phytophthora cactorum]KAG2969587.1 hypothetical protein PC120_g26686 [Phytophthora cactorum]